MRQVNRKLTQGAWGALLTALLLTVATIAAADDVGDSGTVTIEPEEPADSAPGPVTFGQASLWPPIQAVDSNRPVRGVRINFPYGRQDDVAGVDFGLANEITKEMRGVQLGFLNMASDAKVAGVQLGYGNTSAGLTGAQLGFINLNYGPGVGAQLGMINTSDEDFKGFQFGLFNAAKNLRGLQLGLLNRNIGGPLVEYLPLFNAGW